MEVNGIENGNGSGIENGNGSGIENGNLEDLNNEWLEFTKSSINQNNKKHLSMKVSNKNLIAPKCSQLYVSTQTKIAFLNMEIDIYKIYWNLPVILVWVNKEGIIKKSIKINCDNKQQTDNLEKNITDNKENEIYMHVKQLKKIIEKKGKKEKYKDVRKCSSFNEGVLEL